MIESVNNWLDTRREKARVKKWKEGYDYAAGALLRGEKNKLITDIECGMTFDPDSFDRGAIEAVRDWSKKEVGL